jgi:RNA polymerase sigma-70 factor (ECF subfamily)
MNMPEFEAGLLKAVPDIRYFARNLTRDPDAADDLTQDVLEKAIKRRDHFQGGNIAAG